MPHVSRFSRRGYHRRWHCPRAVVGMRPGSTKERARQDRMRYEAYALLRRNPLQKHVIKIHAPGKRLDSDALIFSVGTDIVPVVLLA